MFTFLPPQLLPDVSQGLSPTVFARCFLLELVISSSIYRCFMFSSISPLSSVLHILPVWPTLLPLLLAGLYHIWRATRTSKCGFLKFSPNFTWPKSWHVCSGIGHRLPIIDSFPSLLGALHIGPIPWLAALLVAGRRTSQFVFVSSLNLLKHPKIQRFRGSLSPKDQTSKIWLGLTWLSLHSLLVRWEVSGSEAVTTLPST